MKWGARDRRRKSGVQRRAGIVRLERKNEKYGEEKKSEQRVEW